MSVESQPDIHKHADADGKFRRQVAQFRNFISRDPSSPFPAEKDRYVLYINLLCPWAHRTNIVRSLKGLEDVIQIVYLDWEFSGKGWHFSDTGRDGAATEDPLYGFKYLRELYEKADPGYDKRYTIPTLWDKKKETIVSNESADIIRMFYTEFDEFVEEGRKESVRPMLPAEHLEEIEELNAWVYDTVNNGVYKTGFAATQEAYEENLFPLFASLDRLEKHLGSINGPFLFGEHITDADIRLYTTLIRFDAAYFTSFACNLGMIRHNYPRLHKWLRTLYWDESEETNGGVFKKTTNFDHIKKGYALVVKSLTKSECQITPSGPFPHILPL